MSNHQFSADKLEISLIETEGERGRYYCKYELLVKDRSGQRPDKLIEIADLSVMGGAIRLRDWELNWHQGQPVLSLYLYVSMMGHQLDQWTHYDWATGERLTEFKSQRELSEEG